MPSLITISNRTASLAAVVALAGARWMILEA